MSVSHLLVSRLAAAAMAVVCVSVALEKGETHGHEHEDKITVCLNNSRLERSRGAPPARPVARSLAAGQLLELGHLSVQRGVGGRVQRLRDGAEEGLLRLMRAKSGGIEEAVGRGGGQAGARTESASSARWATCIVASETASVVSSSFPYSWIKVKHSALTH